MYEGDLWATAFNVDSIDRTYEVTRMGEVALFSCELNKPTKGHDKMENA